MIILGRRPLISLLLACGMALAGCRSDQTAAPVVSPPVLQLSASDTFVLRSSEFSTGPALTGSIQAERRADLRAEISALVLEVLKENGDAVRRGDALVRIDETTIRDSLASAEAAQRAAQLTLDQAYRQLERVRTLRASGMMTAQALEDAETRHNNALSELEAAKARAVTARQQLARTVVRAPFDGIVSERRVSAGDTAQIGKELLKVIDPRSKRLEGVVSADQIGNVRAGQTVQFRVNGYAGKRFEGVVRRINPAVNPTTRQVEVLVDFAGADQPGLTGLYAEGNILTEKRAGLALPESAVAGEGGQRLAWRVSAGKLEKRPLRLGERVPRTGEYPVLDGLAEGDVVLRFPSGQLSEGQAVQLPQATTPDAGKS